jgi:hypothetical protein
MGVSLLLRASWHRVKGEKMTTVAENGGKPWTPEEDERLRELAASGATLSNIAEKLDRTGSATKTRAYILRVFLGRLGAKRRALAKEISVSPIAGQHDGAWGANRNPREITMFIAALRSKMGALQAPSDLWPAD